MEDGGGERPSLVSALRKKEEISFQARGIQNIGNTCFLGSVLQILAHTEALCQMLDNLDHQYILDTFILDLLRRTIAEIHRETEDAFSPSEWLGNMHRYIKGYKKGSMEDVAEIWRGVIDKLTEQDKNIGSIFWCGFKQKFLCPNCGEQPLPVVEEPCIPLLMKRRVTQGITSFCDQKIDFKCPSCKIQHTNLKATLSFDLLPDVLTFQLQRTVDSNRNIVPEALEYEPEIILADSNGKRYRYTIYGIIVHFGQNMASGHYISLTRIGSQWLQFNDAVVTPVNQIRYENDAYLLFYKKDNSEVPNFNIHSCFSSHNEAEFCPNSSSQERLMSQESGDRNIRQEEFLQEFPADVLSALISLKETGRGNKGRKRIEGAPRRSGRQRVSQPLDITGAGGMALSRPAIRKFARRAGSKRIKKEMYGETRKAVKLYLRDIVKYAQIYSEHGRRRMISRKDVLRAKKRKGKTGENRSDEEGNRSDEEGNRGDSASDD